jgi:hypothetical protein
MGARPEPGGAAGWTALSSSRGGSAQVARAFARERASAMGWQTTLAAACSRQSEETNAGSFFSGLEVHPVDYTPALEPSDPPAALLPSSRPTRIGRARLTASSRPSTTQPTSGWWTLERGARRAAAGEADLSISTI